MPRYSDSISSFFEFLWNVFITLEKHCQSIGFYQRSILTSKKKLRALGKQTKVREFPNFFFHSISSKFHSISFQWMVVWVRGQLSLNVHVHVELDTLTVQEPVQTHLQLMGVKIAKLFLKKPKHARSKNVQVCCLTCCCFQMDSN